MGRRVLHLLRARLSARPRGDVPIAIWLAHALIATTLCWVVRDVLPPFAYGLFALSLTAALVTIPLLGELGWLLRRDEADEWVSTLPVRPRELILARTLHLLVLLGALALGSLLPAALLAPPTTEIPAQIALPLLGLGLACSIAAVLLLIQNALGDRAEGILVLLQTCLVVGVVVGSVVGLGSLGQLARIPTIGDEHASFLWLYPPAWFAAPLAGAEGEPARWWLPLAVGASAALLLVVLPRPARARSSGSSWLSLLLGPARLLATRFWLRRDERGPFDLIYDALPREREVVLRTVPMLGIPLAFLVLGATREAADSAGRTDVLALLLFSVGVYLPILLTHVPATATPSAVWLLTTSPVRPGAVENGTIKALTLHFLVPLYGLLGFIAWIQEGPGVLLRLALPAFLVALLVLRWQYKACVLEPPLSVSPDEIRFELDRFGGLAALAFLLAIVAVMANRLLVRIPPALALSGVLFVLELGAARRLRRHTGQPGPRP